MPPAGDQNMIQSLTPKRSDQAFSATATSVIMGLSQIQSLILALKGLPVETIIVAHQIGGRRGVTLSSLSQPLRRWIAVTANHSGYRHSWPTTKKANSRSKVRDFRERQGMEFSVQR
jgi:hypothetical protein